MKFTQPPLLRPPFQDSSPPVMRTSYLEALHYLLWHRWRKNNEYFLGVTDSPNPSSAIAVAMSPAERGVAPGATTASGGGTNNSSGGHPHHDVPAAVAANASNSPSSATAAAAAVFSGGAAAAAAVALWSKAPPPATVTAAAQFPVEVTRQLHNIYGEHFPIEVRYALTGWLDASFNEELESGNPQHEEHARALVMTMVQQLEGKAASETDFTAKGRLEQVIENIKVGNPRTPFQWVPLGIPPSASVHV